MTEKNKLAEITQNAIELTSQTLADRVVGSGVGGLTAVSASVDISSIATVFGIVLTVTCFIAQLISVRNAKREEKRRAYAFRQEHPDAPKDL